MDVVCACGNVHQCEPGSSNEMAAAGFLPIPRPPKVVMSQKEFRQFLVNGGVSPAEVEKLCESVENQIA